MAVATVTTGCVTQAIDVASATQRHQLGLVVSLSDGGEALYVQANESLDPYSCPQVVRRLQSAPPTPRGKSAGPS